MSELIDVYKIARLLKVCPRTVLRWVKRGRLPQGVKIEHSRRWDFDEVAAAIEKIKRGQE